MERCRGLVLPSACGTSPAARWRWLAVAGAAGVLAAAVGCTSSATTAPPVTVSPVTVSPTAASLPAAPATSSPDADWPAYDRTAERSGVSVSSPVPGVVRHGHEETGELAGAGQRARGVTVQVGDRGGALLPRSATSPAREPPA